MLPYLPEYLRDAVLFGFLVGWRMQEIFGLLWTNVDRSGQVIRVEPCQTKEGKARKVGDALALHVFHRGGLKMSRCRRSWLTACRKAGLGHHWFHSLRRSAARNMSMQGAPQGVIMTIMGLKTRAMFDRYDIVSEADQRVYVADLFGSSTRTDTRTIRDVHNLKFDVQGI